MYSGYTNKGNMKLVILGATGPSGLQLVEESLERGHEVSALVRDPSKLAHIDNALLKVHKVDIYDDKVLADHFKNNDIIMSCLGSKPSLFGMSTITFYQDTIKAIVSGMRSAERKRLVCMTSWDAVPQHSGPWLFEWVFRPVFLVSVLQSMSVMEDYLVKECQDLEFTVVKPPGLNNCPSSGKEIKGMEGQCIPGMSRRISRRDVAKFMLDCIPKSDWLHKLVAIAST